MRAGAGDCPCDCMNIRIEEKHLEGARKKSPLSCPIAKAILEQIDCQYVVVGYGGNEVSIRNHDGSWLRMMPKDPQKFRDTLNHFDAPYWMEKDIQQLIGTELAFNFIP